MKILTTALMTTAVFCLLCACWSSKEEAIRLGLTSYILITVGCFTGVAASYGKKGKVKE